MRVTHPFHPLHGREFELVDRRRTWGEDRIYYYDRGALKRMPAAWTSAATPDRFVAVSAGRSLFRVADLIELANLVALHRKTRAPSPRPAKRRASRK